MKLILLIVHASLLILTVALLAGVWMAICQKDAPVAVICLAGAISAGALAWVFRPD